MTAIHSAPRFLASLDQVERGFYLASPPGDWIQGEDAAAWMAHLFGLAPPGARRHRKPSKVPAGLRDAYAATDYVVHATPELYVRIGEQHLRELAALMVDEGCRTAAIVTAWNPYSHQLPPEDNRLRQLQLHHDLRAAGIAWLPVEGRDPSGVWQAEASVLAFGLDADGARELMARYQQHAIVWLSIGEPASLFFMEDVD